MQENNTSGNENGDDSHETSQSRTRASAMKRWAKNPMTWANLAHRGWNLYDEHFRDEQSQTRNLVEHYALAAGHYFSNFVELVGTLPLPYWIVGVGLLSVTVVVAWFANRRRIDRSR